MIDKPRCPYVVHYWKYTDETKKTYTVATPEDAEWTEIKLGKIQYAVEKFQLPQDLEKMYRFQQYLEEAYFQGRGRGKQEVRQALGIG